MAVEFTAEDFSRQLDHNIVSMTISGKLDVQDYDFFVPKLERFIEKHDDARMLIHLNEFKGWTPGALWEDTKFGVRHFNDINRIAVVGDKTWEKGMVNFLSAFTRAQVHYFDAAAMEEALKWLTK